MRALLIVPLAACAACHRAPEEVAPPPPTSTMAAAAPAGASGSAASPSAVSAKVVVPGCPDDPEPHHLPLPVATLTIAGFDTKPFEVEAEVAWGDHDTQRGLMYRTSMPEMHGMIFELDRSDHAFWMHNTCIGLDLVYIDRGQIVGIVEAAPILNDEARGVGKLSDEVLELNAGFCRRHGVKVGQHVTRREKSG